MDPGKLHAKKQRRVAFHSSSAPNSLWKMTRAPDHLETTQETPIDIVDDVQKKNLFGPSSLTELDNVYNMIVSKHSFALSEYNEAFKKLELLQADVHQMKDVEERAQEWKDFVKTMQVKRSTILWSAPPLKVPPMDVEHLTKVEFAGGNKCEEQNSKVLLHDEKEDGLDKEAEPNAEVEIVGGYKCDGKDPKVEVDVEKEAMLEKNSLENGDQAKKCPSSSMKDNEVSSRYTNPSILQTIQMMQRERKRKMTDAATSNIDNLDHVISMIAKSTMKDPHDLDTSLRVEGQIPCASNIEDQEDKNSKSFVLSTGGDASCAGGAIGASGAGNDTEIIIDKSKPPQENGDASVDAGGAVVQAVQVNTRTLSLKSLNHFRKMVVIQVVGGAVGAGDVGEDMEIIIEKSEPPQEDGDASMDVGADSSCTAGAVGAGGVEYVRHNDGTVSRQREDGGSAGGVASYVRNDDGTVSHPWEDFGNILFESKPALILDINGVLLTSIDKRYHSQMLAY
ncbi:hypothetical protein L7F22_066616 [Adiantum nelumboides]|nr:hypothetical protein [Adiantum nelumboides]